MKTETYACQSCGINVVRPVVRGQRPKWCPDCRKRERGSKPCLECGKPTLRKAKGYCSTTCAQVRRRKPKPPRKQPADMRGPLRRGYEDGDADLFFAALASRADTSGDCWVWNRLNRSGYPVVSWSGREIALHRAAVEMKHGASLGSQHAHHTCANAACVNPDHLQPVTHRDNVAEMLARRSYLARIQELEAALTEVDPNHPLLAVVKVA